ncbi:MAG: hypothetical protein WC373_10875 [Smithella sp.]|jgi:hypothetical protein
MKRSKTKTLIQAMRTLSKDIESQDGIPNAAILEAADRLEEIAKLLKDTSGAMSHERWPTKFREKVERVLS